MKNLSNHNRKMTFSHMGKALHPIRNQLSKWISQFATFSHSVVVGTTSIIIHKQKFVEFPQVFLQITYKPQIMTESFNRFITLEKPIKKYIQEEQNKKTRTKTRWDARWACLANFSTEGRAKKSFKEGNYAVSLFRRQRVLPSKEMCESSKQTT